MVPISRWRSFGAQPGQLFRDYNVGANFRRVGLSSACSPHSLFSDTFEVFCGFPYSFQRNLLPVFIPCLPCMVPPPLSRLLLLRFLRPQKVESVKNKILETLMVRERDATRIRTYLESSSVVYRHEQNWLIFGAAGFN